MPVSLAAIRIILVEPAGALNVGSVARVMKNMGLNQLVLVRPRCDRLGSEALQMAVHAADVLTAAVEVDTVAEALQGCQRAIATTGRDRATLDRQLEHPRTALPWLLPLSSSDPNLSQPTPIQTALLFGREDSGLTNEELTYAQRFVQIPASPLYSSLNLAQAVAICCYELAVAAANDTNHSNDLNDHQTETQIEPQERRSTEHPATDSTPSEGWAERIDPPTDWANRADLADLADLDGYYRQLEALLLKIGYLYPHTAASRMDKFRRLFNRAYPTATEVSMLRGILSQVEWALQTKLPL